jgi:hypothetical protein
MLICGDMLPFCNKNTVTGIQLCWKKQAILPLAHTKTKVPVYGLGGPYSILTN